MANSEHLDILRQGVETWNQWRKDNPKVSPDFGKAANLGRADLGETKLGEADLSGAVPNKIYLSKRTVIRDESKADPSLADLSGADLREANLSGANFCRAVLSGANLSETNLREAELSGADLREANLSGAKLNRANFSGADLSGANLREANLYEANLSHANLAGADLSRAYLLNANLSTAWLLKANLSGANLREANLSEAFLAGVNLSGANLLEANLYEAECHYANLNMASLRVARLINTKLDGAILSGAWLWETQRAGWSIKGVICESVYWDEHREEETIYSNGDFERLFTEKTKVKLFYKDGINPLEIATLPALIKHLEALHSGCGLRLVGISEDSGGVVVELAIEEVDNHSSEQLKQLKTEIETTARRAIEIERKFLAEERQRLQLEGEVKQLTSFVDKLILRPGINVQGDYMGDTYNVENAIAVGANVHSHDNTFNQIVSQLEKSINLTALAKELSELRQTIVEKQDPSQQSVIALVEIEKAEIAAKEKNASKVVEHLKTAGKWALDFAKELGKDLAVEAIKQSMGVP